MVAFLPNTIITAGMCGLRHSLEVISTHPFHMTYSQKPLLIIFPRAAYIHGKSPWKDQYTVHTPLVIPSK